MAYTAFILACLFLPSQVFALIDAPPKIEATSPGRPGDPVSYISVAIIVDDDNVLTCEASNADEVYWEISDTIDQPVWGNLSTKTNFLMKETYVTVGGDRLKAIASDETWRTERVPSNVRGDKVKGYYRCVASNKYNFKTLSPVIWLVSETVSTLNPNLAPKEEKSAKQGESITLPCFGMDSTYGPEKLKRYKKPNSQWAKVIDGKEKEKSTYNAIVDPVSGSLVFTNLIPNDTVRTPDDDKTSENNYKCAVKISNSPTEVYTGRYELIVVSSDTTPTKKRLLPLLDDKDDRNNKYPIRCLAGRSCDISCLFGGVNGPAKLEKKSRGDSTEDATESTATGLLIKDITTSSAGDWECSHGSAPPDQTATIELIVEEFPKLATIFEDQFMNAKNGLATFSCKPVAYQEPSTTVKFYKNGVEVTDTTENASVERGWDLVLKLQENTEGQSASIQCVLTNDLGSSYFNAILVVYDEPKITMDPELINVIEGKNVTAGSTYTFNCTMLLDPKAKLGYVYWFTSRRGGQKVTQKDTEGVKSLETTPFIKAQLDDKLESFLTLVLDSTSKELISNTEWSCSVEYTVPPSSEVRIKNSTVGTFLTSQPVTQRVVDEFDSWWIIGVVGAVVFLVILILLIICCVRENKGEQYYVDDKERKAGHNPEEELQAYGFQDYQRQDQNPVKGSRASMNFSDKPIESDQGSMEEYGDIDTGRFNEDGSFIGEYRQRRNEADV